MAGEGWEAGAIGCCCCDFDIRGSGIVEVEGEASGIAAGEGAAEGAGEGAAEFPSLGRFLYGPRLLTPPAAGNGNGAAVL